MSDGEGEQGTAPPNTAERLGSRELYTGRKVRLAVDRVRLPNGRVTDIEMIRHPGAAAIVALLGLDVLLVRQYRYATGGWLLEVPAGTFEDGELPAACAARELEEETGFRSAALEHLGWIWSTPGFTDEKIWLFLATGLTPARQGLEHDEVLTVERLPFAEAVARAAGGAIADGKSVAALLRAAHHLQR